MMQLADIQHRRIRIKAKWARLKTRAYKTSCAAVDAYWWSHRNVVTVEDTSPAVEFWIGHEVAMQESCDHALRFFAKEKKAKVRSGEWKDV